jgi:hypothetical protein
MWMLCVIDKDEISYASDAAKTPKDKIKALEAL